MCRHARNYENVPISDVAGADIKWMHFLRRIVNVIYSLLM